MSANAVAKDTESPKFNKFIDYLRDTKKAPFNTVQAYKSDLKRFADYISEKGLDTLANVGKDEVDGFKETLSDMGLSSATISRSLSAVRSMMQFYVFAGLMQSNPAREIHNDKPGERVPFILSEKDVERLLSQPSGRDAKSVRDKAILELLYATGIKATELIEMNLSDVNLPLSYIRCRKKDRERIIPIYSVAVKSLANYINSARKMLVFDSGEQALFVNVSGDRMTRQGLWKIIKIYAEAANIFGRITPHTLRDSFAVHLLGNGADVHEVQEALGHKEISSTLRYARLLKESHKKGYIKFHPRA